MAPCKGESVRKCGCIILALVFVMFSVLLIERIAHDKYYSKSREVLNQLKQQLTCAKCIKCKGNPSEMPSSCSECAKLQMMCYRRGWNLNHYSAPHKSCVNNPLFYSGLTKIVDDSFSRTKQEFKRKAKAEDHDEKKATTLKHATKAFYQSPRCIVHWFLSGPQRVNKDGWTVITDYQNHRSIKKVSPGPPDSFNDGKLIVTEDGLHFVYAKITFECHEADPTTKRISVAVVVENKEVTPMLKNTDTGQCAVKGELLSVYQSGIFSFKSGWKIFTQYKAPKNVSLYNERGPYPSKSYIGLVRLGRLYQRP